MKAKDIVRILRKHKGKVYAGVLGSDDVIYLQIVKADAIEEFSDDPDQETGFRVSYTGRDLYIDNES